MAVKVRLSQCMIVKNEEDNIERALTWGKGIVAEQIVVDTGSTDRTVEIAKRMGAKVFQITWEGDFSSAKNYAIDKASGNWIAFLDADEYYKPEDAEKMLELIQYVEKNADKRNFPHVISNLMYHLDDNGEVSSTSRQDRIFKKVDHLRYINRVHEVLCLDGGKGKLIRLNADDNLVIYHTGYAPKVMEQKQKGERNISLLKKELESDPENYIVLSYLGDTYMSQKMYREAEETYSIVVLHTHEIKNKARIKAAYSSLMQLIVQRNVIWDEPRLQELYASGKNILPHDADLDYWMGVWAVQQERWEEAFTQLEKSLMEQNHYEQEGTSYLLSHLDVIYYMLIIAAQHLDDKPAIVKYSTLTLKLNRYNTDVLRLLLALFRWEADSERNAQEVMGLLEKLYDFGSLKDKLTVLKYAKQVDFKYLEEQIWSTLTDEEKQWMDS